MNESAHWIAFRAGLGGLPSLLLAASCARPNAPALLLSSAPQAEPTRGASAGLAVQCRPPSTSEPRFAVRSARIA